MRSCLARQTKRCKNFLYTYKQLCETSTKPTDHRAVHHIAQLLTLYFYAYVIHLPATLPTCMHSTPDNHVIELSPNLHNIQHYLTQSYHRGEHIRRAFCGFQYLDITTSC